MKCLSRGRMNRLTTSLRTSGGAIENLQSKMMAFAAVAATAFVVSLPIQHAIKFADAMADVNNVMDFKRPDGLRLMGRDILDLSKLEARKFEIEITDCPLKQLLDGIESLLKPGAEKKGIEVEFIEDDGLPLQIRTDSKRLRQCLLNLVFGLTDFPTYLIS